MAVTPTSSLSKAMHALRRLVASSETFRDITSSLNEAAALNHVYLFESRADTDSRPLAIIGLPEYQIDKSFSSESHEAFVLTLAFEFVPSAATQSGGPADEATWFANEIGNILDEMGENSGQHNAADEGYSAIRGVSMVQPFASGVEDLDQQQERFWGVTFRIETQ